MDAIVPYERSLGERFLDKLPDSVTVYGLPTLEGRVPTFLVNVEGAPAAEVATRLGERGIGVWAHNTWYSLNLYQRLGYEGDAIRIGFIHYNTADEVDRLVSGLGRVGTALVQSLTATGGQLGGCRSVRTAQASWSGTVPDGGGRLALGSGAFEGPFTLRAPASRTASQARTPRS